MSERCASCIPDEILWCAGMLAPDGRCKTLDGAANGYVRSEGLGMLMLRSATTVDSHRPGDAQHPHMIVSGAAINQDGRSSGLTAPNGPAQSALMRDALANAGLAPHKVRSTCSAIKYHLLGLILAPNLIRTAAKSSFPPQDMTFTI